MQQVAHPEQQSVGVDRAGRERLAFKADVRKLKELGLTESLEVGFQLSPRGRAVLRRLADQRAAARRVRRRSGAAVCLGGLADDRETEAEARRLIEDAGFRVSRVTDSSTKAKKGNVLQQSPNSGQTLDKGSTVTIVVSRFSFGSSWAVIVPITSSGATTVTPVVAPTA